MNIDFRTLWTIYDVIILQWSSALTFALLNFVMPIGMYLAITYYNGEYCGTSAAGITALLHLNPYYSANGIHVELTTETGEEYASTTPLEQLDGEESTAYKGVADLELTAFAANSRLYGVAKADDEYSSGFDDSNSRLIHSDGATDQQVSAKKIFPGYLRCGVDERFCALIVCALSFVIALATLAMQGLNPSSSVAG